MGLLNIIYQDEALVAIDKPDALLVHRTRLSRDHVFALQLLRDQIGQRVYPVHRLDRPTSGVLLFALSSDAARQCGEAFTSRRVRKTYRAVVRGYTDDEGVIEYALREDRDSEPQDATTTYRRLGCMEVSESMPPHGTVRYSLVEITPQTGRMHQIRKHFAHIRHPVVGDTQHGDGKHNRFFREHFGIRRLLLHACRLELPHPVTDAPLVIEAPLPDEFADLAFASLTTQAAATSSELSQRPLRGYKNL